ncbi:hypothetical protein TNCV_4697361 [Trichonephila clavipes]|nr:hypothetical protein TNCV_4697361 [Trichonephila clavipes]
MLKIILAKTTNGDSMSSGDVEGMVNWVHGLGLCRGPLLFLTRSEKDHDPNKFNRQMFLTDIFTEKLGASNYMQNGNNGKTTLLCEVHGLCPGLGLRPHTIIQVSCGSQSSQFVPKAVNH